MTPAPRSIEKALILLNTLILAEDKPSLTAAAQRLGLPLATAHRHMTALERSGLLIREGRKGFLPGLVLLELAGACGFNRLLVTISRPFLKDLARTERVTTHLGVFDGEMVTYLVKEASAASKIFTREGMQLEGYCSGIGKVLLAALPQQSRQAYLENGPFVALTERTIVDADKLAEEISAVEQRGYAIDDAEVDASIYCVAVPLRYKGSVVAALSISMRAESLDPAFVNASLSSLQRCAHKIEDELSARSWTSSAFEIDAGSA